MSSNKKNYGEKFMKNTNTIQSNQEQEQDENFENNYKMLLYFQDEYKYRHKHFWSTLKMFFILNIVISLLPFISSILDFKINIPKFTFCIFPIVGIFMAIVSFIFLKSEAEKFSLIKQKKYCINKLLDDKYHYINQPKKQMSFRLNLVNMIFQILVAVGSLAVCIVLSLI